MMDREKIRNYMLRLGKIINELLNSSEELRSLVKEIEAEGYKISIGFVSVVSGAGESEELRFEITSEDKRFLEDIGIRYDEDDDDNDNDD